MSASITRWTLIGFAVAAIAVVAHAASKTADGTTIQLNHSAVTRVYDGDTFYINIPDMPAVFGKNLGVRLHGIDTPEMRSSCKTEAQRAAEKKLALDAKDSLTSKIRNAKVIELTDLKRDKYFRLLATVKLDGQDVAEQLIADGYARAYDGGKKVGWCQ